MYDWHYVSEDSPLPAEQYMCGSSREFKVGDIMAYGRIIKVTDDYFIWEDRQQSYVVGKNPHNDSLRWWINRKIEDTRIIYNGDEYV